MTTIIITTKLEPKSCCSILKLLHKIALRCIFQRCTGVDSSLTPLAPISTVNGEWKFNSVLMLTKQISEVSIHAHDFYCYTVAPRTMGAKVRARRLCRQNQTTRSTPSRIWTPKQNTQTANIVSERKFLITQHVMANKVCYSSTWQFLKSKEFNWLLLVHTLEPKYEKLPLVTRTLEGRFWRNRPSSAIQQI